MLQIDNNGKINDLGIKSVSFALDDEQKVLLYPNPASTQTTISFSAGMSKLDVTDVGGKILKTTKLNVTDTSFLLEVAQYPAGTYFIRLTLKSGLVVKKLIKL